MTADPLTMPTEADLAAMLPPRPDAPADTPPAKGKAKRPTTRAGRAAKSAEARARGDKKPGTRTPRQSSLETRLADSLTQVGVLVAGVGAGTGRAAVQADGLAVIRQAPALASALDGIAKDDPRVRAALERLLTVSTWGALVSACIPLVASIAANHGMIPAEIAALVAPDTQPVAPEPAP